MQDMVMVQFDRNDKELLSAIKESFGEQAELVQGMAFDIHPDYITAVLPIVPILAQFVLTYFATKKGESYDSRKPLKRVVISKDGKEISIEAESIQDVERILGSLTDT
mgnify:FL=1